MKITILGCGHSSGVPLIGNNWGLCNPNNPRNRRRRSSILVEEGDTTLLIDTSPDIREQLLDCNLHSLTAVVYTHAHADHLHGIDDLRALNWLMQKPIPIYADWQTLAEIQERFGYVFPHVLRKPDDFIFPVLQPHLIDGPFKIGPIEITPFDQKHGRSSSVGFRFNDFAYSPDVSDLEKDVFPLLENLKLWIVDAATPSSHQAHSHVEKTLGWIDRVKPKAAYLTHMGQYLDYDELLDSLPKGVLPAHDGLVIEI